MRLIDADALIAKLEERKDPFVSIGYLSGLCKAQEYIDDAPTVEPWWDEILVICDNCGHAIHIKKGENEQ